MPQHKYPFWVPTFAFFIFLGSHAHFIFFLFLAAREKNDRRSWKKFSTTKKERKKENRKRCVMFTKWKGAVLLGVVGVVHGQLTSNTTALPWSVAADCRVPPADCRGATYILSYKKPKIFQDLFLVLLFLAFAFVCTY